MCPVRTVTYVSARSVLKLHANYQLRRPLVLSGFPRPAAGFPRSRFAPAALALPGRTRCKLFLLDFRRVRPNHLLGTMAGDRHDLVRRAAGLCERGRRRVPKPVEVKIVEAEFIEMGAHHLAQRVGSDRLPFHVRDEEQAGERARG
jgi:hypothetical protein